MKKCIRCKEDKSLEEFNKNSAKKDGYQNFCRDCYRLHRQKNYGKYKINISERNHRLVKVRQKLVIDYLLEHPCVDCNETNIIVLEFDHLRDKIMDIATMVRSRISLSKIRIEIEKCEVVCSNCHAKRTAERNKNYKWIFNNALEMLR